MLSTDHTPHDHAYTLEAMRELDVDVVRTATLECDDAWGGSTRRVTVKWLPETAEGADPALDNAGWTPVLWRTKPPVYLTASRRTGEVCLRNGIEHVNGQIFEGIERHVEEDLTPGTYCVVEDVNTTALEQAGLDRIRKTLLEEPDPSGNTRRVVVKWLPKTALGADPALDNVGRTPVLWDEECPITLQRTRGTNSVTLRERIRQVNGEIFEPWRAPSEDELGPGAYFIAEDEMS